MNFKFSIAGMLFLLVISAQAQMSKKQLDKESIKEMCGCFEVTFNFAETFNYSKDSLYKPSKQKITGGLEWAQLVSDEGDEVVIQHLLQVGPPDNPYIVKHWRQDWLYENQDFYMFDGDNKWEYERKSAEEVDGQWTQKVYQVDDSPRYEGSATWVHVDGKSYWENLTTAPLPRREYTVRSDYNVTLRGNRVEIKDNGWVHDQDNHKVVRKEGLVDFVLADEKGYNVYKRVDDSRCQAAQDWWQEHQDRWALVRSKWDEVFERNANLELREKVDNKVLFKYLLSPENIEDYDEEEEIDALIEKFVIEP